MEIHCDVCHDASVTASAMQRCGELSSMEVQDVNLSKGMSFWSMCSFKWFQVRLSGLSKHCSVAIYWEIQSLHWYRLEGIISSCFATPDPKDSLEKWHVNLFLTN